MHACLYGIYAILSPICTTTFVKFSNSMSANIVSRHTKSHLKCPCCLAYPTDKLLNGFTTYWFPWQDGVKNRIKWGYIWESLEGQHTLVFRRIGYKLWKVIFTPNILYHNFISSLSSMGSRFITNALWFCMKIIIGEKSSTIVTNVFEYLEISDPRLVEIF